MSKMIMHWGIISASRNPARMFKTGPGRGDGAGRGRMFGYGDGRGFGDGHGYGYGRGDEGLLESYKCQK